jgi:hypothetical protein
MRLNLPSLTKIALLALVLLTQVSLQDETVAPSEAQAADGKAASPELSEQDYIEHAFKPSTIDEMKKTLELTHERMVKTHLGNPDRVFTRNEFTDLCFEFFLMETRKVLRGYLITYEDSQDSKKAKKLTHDEEFKLAGYFMVRYYTRRHCKKNQTLTNQQVFDLMNFDVYDAFNKKHSESIHEILEVEVPTFYERLQKEARAYSAKVQQKNAETDL